MPASSLRVEFATEEEFRREYANNIANGGIFVASQESFEVRDLVRVELVLSYCDRIFEFDAEVVHCVPPEMAEAGARPGAALQFHADIAELRAELEPLAAPLESGDEHLSRSGRRRALRSPIRLPAKLQLADGSWIAARTRNLSSSGALLGSPGRLVPVGSAVTVVIQDAAVDEELVVEGVVVRHVACAEDKVAALGIEFNLPEPRQRAVREFVNRVRSAQHSRRLGGIMGPIGELGVESLVTMFGSTAPRGTLTLTRGVHEGFVAFEKGLLRAAELADATGLEALALLLAWTDGDFEFEMRVESALPKQAPLPLDAAIREAKQGAVEEARPERERAAATRFEAADHRDLDLELDLDFDRESGSGSEEEGGSTRSHGTRAATQHGDFPRLSPDAALSIDRAAVDAARGELSKTEQALVDLAEVGMTVAKAVEVVPEPRDDVHRALRELIDRGLLLVRS